MKLQAVLVGLGLLHIVIGFGSQQSPGKLVQYQTLLHLLKILIATLDCLSRCWNNSKYVSTCLEANGNQCLCKDDEFQNVGIQIC